MNQENENILPIRNLLHNMRNLNNSGIAQILAIIPLSSNMQNDIENIPEQDDIPIVIKIEELNKLKKCYYKDLVINEKELNKKCPITLEEFIEDEYILELPCKHIFKLEPINEWLLNNSHTCPVCRNSAGKSEPKIQ